MKAGLLGVVAAAVVGAAPQASRAQHEGAAAEAPASAAEASASASASKSNWFQRLRKRLPAAHDDAASAAGTTGTVGLGEPASAAAPTMADPLGGPVKIKEIDRVPRGRSPAADRTCKNLVEPFGVSDSAISLAAFQLKCKAASIKPPFGLPGLPGFTPATPTGGACDIHQAARQLNWLPMPLELQIGQQAHDKKSAAGELLADDRRGRNAYQTARRMLADVLAQVKEPTPYRFAISVTNRSGGNAEAAPGGFLYIDRDLVTRPEKAGLATFALAHEVSHVLQRHETRELQLRLTDGIDTFEDLSKTLAATLSDPKLLLKRANDLKQLYMLHSEEQELQADGCGVRLLSSLMPGPELTGAIDAFIHSLPPPQPPQPPRAPYDPQSEIANLRDGQFSSHPSTQARVQNLQTMLGEVQGVRLR